MIERQLTFKPGDLYRRSLVQDSQRRLYGLELFQFANIELAQTREQQPAEMPMRITVAEGNHQRVNFGVGYGTEEKARVDAEYHHVNFFGGARSAGVHARWSSLDRGLRLDFNQPYFFTPHFSFGREGQQWYTYTPAYRSVVTGGEGDADASQQRPATSWSVSITSERDSSSIRSDGARQPDAVQRSLIALGLDPHTGEQNGTLNALGFDFQHSTADNVLNAHRGYQLAFHAEEAGRSMPGTFNYYALSADGRHYLPFGERLVLASRLQLGNIRPVGNDADNVPFSKGIFLGGATSIRGWGRYEVSPLARSGLPVGGNSMLAFSEEMRADVARQARRRAVPRCRQRLGRLVRLQAERSALRGRAGPALPDAGRSDPIRLRLSAEPDSGAARERRAATRAAGASTSASGRRSRCRDRFEPIRMRRRACHARLIVADAARRRDGGGVIVSQTAWFKNWLRGLHRRAGATVSERHPVDRAARRQSVFRRRDGEHRRVDGRQPGRRGKDLGLDYNVFELITKGLSVDEIRLDKPVIYLRRDGDMWSISRLVKKQEQEADRQGPARPVAIDAIEIATASWSVDSPVGTGGVDVPKRFDHLDAKLSFKYRAGAVFDRYHPCLVPRHASRRLR